MTPVGLRRVGLVLAGVVTGLLGLALGLWFYLQAARIDEVRSQIGERVRIAREAIERIEVIEETAIRITLRDVAIVDAAGTALFEAPRALLTLDPETVSGDGPIEFYDVAFIEPTASLVRSPDGVWNILEATGMTAGGQPVETEPGRGIVLRGVEIEDGEAVIALPAQPPAADASFALQLPLTTIGGQTYQRYTVTGVDAVLPMVRIGGEDGWRVEVADLAGLVVEPNIRIATLEGSFEQQGSDGMTFDLDVARFGSSQLSGAGTIVFGDEGTLYDLALNGAPLSVGDLRGLLPTLPAEGVARFDLAVESLSPNRVSLAFSGLDVDAMGSRVTGALAVAVGGETPLALLDAAIELAPLDLATLEQLGMVEDFPLLGQVTGGITTAGAPEGFASVNLTGQVRPRDNPDVPTSTLIAAGLVAAGDADEPLRMAGLQVGLQPLYLAALRGFAPEQADRLRGELRGSVTLDGTLARIQLRDGDLSYDVGEAAPSRLTSIEGTIVTDPALAYDISAVAEPLAFATIRELFPAVPFRATTLSGPIAFVGDASDVEIDADLSGPAGGIALTGSVAFGDPPVFDFEGNVRAFQAGMLLRPEVPVQGPLTGSFSVEGSMQNLAFSVDLTQAEGRFTLAGTLNGSQESPVFRVGGQVSAFQLGALFGEPGLFPRPMSGRIDIAGGGGEPYTFDVDLTGEATRLDVSGVYAAGDVPTYNVAGFVDGLDLASLPLPIALPRSLLTGRFDIEGRGLDLETLGGTYSFDFGQSTVSGLQLDEAAGQIEVTAGVAFVDTLQVRLEGTFLAASGSWGLERPAAEPLRYRLVSPDLSAIARVFAPGELVPPQMAGSVEATGTIGGSIEFPEVTTDLEGRGLRYEAWEAATLSLDLDAARDPVAGWNGTMALVGDQLVLPQVDRLQTLRVEASGSEAALAVGLFASRDAATDLAFSGLLELEGVRPLGVGLETMTVRVGDVAWELLNSARLRYVQDDGLLIENLNLQRQGGETGMLSIHGQLPPTGDAELRVTAVDVDLADLRRLVPTAPAVEGKLSLVGVLDGPVSSPDLTVSGQAVQVGMEGVLTDSLDFDLDYAAGLLTGFARGITDGQPLLDAEVAVPMRLSLENRILPAIEFDENAPLAATVRADSLPLEVIATLSPMFADGVGTARAQIDVGGTIDSPALSGWARVEDGSVTVVPLQTRYSGIQADVALDGNTAVINRFTIRNGGPMDVTGSIAFPSGVPPQLDLSASFRDFQVMNDSDLAELVASGNLAIQGPTSSAVVTGAVEVKESTLRVPDLMAAEPELALAYPEFEDLGATGIEVAGPPLVGNFRIDGVEVLFGESVWLESEDMRVQIAGEVVLYQAAQELRVFGALEALRGTYTLEVSGIVRDFDVVSGRVQFFGTGDLNPSLDIVAAYRVPGGSDVRRQATTVLINISGTLLAPRLALSADAPVQLSEADLLSILFFGRPNFELATFGASTGFGLVAQEIVGAAVAAEIERPIVRAGLCDWVRVRPGSVGDLETVFGSAFSRALIECGWELAPSLFLTAEAGIGGLFGGDFTEGRVSLEWQIDDYWMWEASYGALQRDPIRSIFNPVLRREFSTDLTRRWEYGRPRNQDAIDFVPDPVDAPVEITPTLPPTPIGIRDDVDAPVAGGTE